MKRRTFLAAVTPLIAAVSSASGQSPLGATAPADPTRPLGGRLRVAGAPVASTPETAPAAGNAPGETKKAKGPTEITSREAMLDNRIHLATFSGEVNVKDPEYNLTCDKLTVHLKKPKAKGEAKPAGPRPIGATEDDPQPKAAPEPKGDGGGIEKAIAEGNVVIVQDKIDAGGKKQRYYGKARRAVYDPDKKTCILYGWPRISQSTEGEMGKEIVAEQESTVITLDQAGIIKADGPNRVRLNDVDALQQNPAPQQNPGAR